MKNKLNTDDENTNAILKQLEIEDDNKSSSSSEQDLDW